MAAKKKRKPRRPPASGAWSSTARPRAAAPFTATGTQGAGSQAKEAARKRRAALGSLRRVTTFVAIGAIGVGIVWFFQRAASPRPVSEAAIAAAEGAGCSEVQTPGASAPGGVHLQPGESATYPEHPATSGPHDPSPLPIPPRVYTEPISETTPSTTWSTAP